MQVVEVVDALVGVLLGGGAAQHGLDAGGDFLGVKGLDDVVVGAQLQTQHLIVGLALGCQHDNGGVVLGADLAADFPSVHYRHHNVQQDQVGMQFVKVGQGCFAVMGHRDRVALLDQVKTQQFADIFIVIDNEDLFVCHNDSILSAGFSCHPSILL